MDFLYQNHRRTNYVTSGPKMAKMSSASLRKGVKKNSGADGGVLHFWNRQFHVILYYGV